MGGSRFGAGWRAISYGAPGCSHGRAAGNVRAWEYKHKTAGRKHQGAWLSWLERSLHTAEVTGSSPVTPTNYPLLRHICAGTLNLMAEVRIYHNPACSHSRGALEILEKRAPDARVVLYLETPPSRAELEQLIDMLDEAPAELVRKDKRFAELGLIESDYQSPEQVVGVLLNHPELMQRPIIVKGDRAVLARPSEKVLPLLDA